MPTKPQRFRGSITALAVGGGLLQLAHTIEDEETVISLKVSIDVIVGFPFQPLRFE